MNSRFLVLCGSAQADLYSRFFRDGQLVESNLAQPKNMQDFMLSALRHKSPLSKSDLIRILSRTFWARRLQTNPGYYGCSGTESKDRFASRKIDLIVGELRKLGCMSEDQNEIHLLPLGTRINIEVDQLVALQSTSYEKASSILKRKGMLQNGVHSDSEREHRIVQYYTHLPRATRDYLAVAEGEFLTREPEILLIGYTKGRIPAQEALRQGQADVIEDLLPLH